MADVMADKSPNAVDQTPQCSTLVDELILVKAKRMSRFSHQYHISTLQAPAQSIVGCDQVGGAGYLEV
jgi:hypothetical protein